MCGGVGVGRGWRRLGWRGRGAGGFRVQSGCPARLSADGSRAVKIFANALFDESHGNAWSIRPGVPEQMNPANAADASYQQAAELLRHLGHEVSARIDGLFDTDALEPYDVLVLAHPSEATWERTTWVGSPVLTPA